MENKSGQMTKRPKMSREERAKQFMPFAALKGYEQALLEKEKIVVPERELPEEYKEELDRKLRQIRKNDIITVVYFSGKEYLKKTGMVVRIDHDAKMLKVVNTKIAFHNIYDLAGENII